MTIISSSSEGPKAQWTADESIITAGLLEGMATGSEFVEGPPRSLSPTASVIAGEAGDDTTYARLQHKCEVADFAVGRQPAIANLNC
jgi:hypothetical protein